MNALTRPLPWIALNLLLVALLTSACAPALVGPASAPETPAGAGVEGEVAVPRDGEDARVSLGSEEIEEQAGEVENRAREAFQRGIDLFRSGHRLEAEEYFEEALLIILGCDPVVARHPRVLGTYDEMVAALNDLEGEIPDDLEAAEGAASDLLAEIDVAISPERAIEEAETVAGASEVVTYDIPMEVNDQVLAWVDVYTGKLRDSFARGLERSGWYLPMIKEIFAEEGIPTDLAYMAHVESSYKPSAYSRAHAKGVFQFISSTGQRYGLRRDWWIDERSDPEKSTRAAAHYLKDLYDEFGDWYLALASYNGGEGRVRRGIAMTGKQDFWALSRARYLRRETRNYVPAILAAILISRNPGAYGFGEVQPFPPVTYDTVTVDTPTDLRVIAECAGADLEDLKRLNPALYRTQTPPGNGAFEVKIPAGSAERFIRDFAQVPVSERLRFTFHKIHRGDTLSTIARHYGTSVRAIQEANGMGRRTLIRAGKVLKVPSSSASLRAGGPWDDVSDYEVGQTIRYRVRRGDTLSTIARRHRTSVKAIQAMNGLTGTRIIAGKSLSIAYGRTSVPARAATSPPQAVTNGEGAVVVRRGDTLIALARRYGTTVSALQQANGLGRSSRIYAGQTLRMPGGSATGGTAAYHRVSRGDTLSRIARRYGTSVATLCHLNQMSADDLLYPGQTLRISR